VPPDFLIVGVPRSGTSSLSHHLRQDPQIHMAKGKELHLFDKRWNRGIEWNRGQFQGISRPGSELLVVAGIACFSSTAALSELAARRPSNRGGIDS
jgi:hypothetical protein